MLHGTAHASTASNEGCTRAARVCLGLCLPGLPVSASGCVGLPGSACARLLVLAWAAWVCLGLPVLELCCICQILCGGLGEPTTADRLFESCFEAFADGYTSNGNNQLNESLQCAKVVCL